MDQRPRLSGLLHSDAAFAPLLVSYPEIERRYISSCSSCLKRTKILPAASVRANSQQGGLVERLARLSKSGVFAVKAKRRLFLGMRFHLEWNNQEKSRDLFLKNVSMFYLVIFHLEPRRIEMRLRCDFC